MTSAPKLLGTGPVILVDDNESDAFLARKCYERSSLTNEFVWLPLGTDLVELIEAVRAGNAELPAFVLLDINIPGLSGFETLTSVRALPEFHDVPIIMMLTNSNDPRDIEQSAQLGANGFFTKPSDIGEYIRFFESLQSDSQR